MYNRYTQKPDGSFKVNRMTEPVKQEQLPRPMPAPPPPPPPPPPSELRQSTQTVNLPPFNFLKQLLPKGFDMGDLAIVFLLLLMAGDNEENRSNALLTIALYFIM